MGSNQSWCVFPKDLTASLLIPVKVALFEYKTTSENKEAIDGLVNWLLKNANTETVIKKLSLLFLLRSLFEYAACYCLLVPSCHSNSSFNG